MTTASSISMTRQRVDKRHSISMTESDHERLLRLQQRLDAVSASEVYRAALRALERELDLADRKAKRRKR